MFNYSVIIPYKNNWELLKVAVESVPNRDDIEIVVVDDKSDNRLVLAEHDFLQHKNLSYIYTDAGKGAGYARNVGIDNSDSKWLLFLDSDDYFAPGAFNTFDLYLESDYDIVHFNQQGIDLNSGEYSSRCELFSQLIIYYSDLRELMGSNTVRYKFHTPYVKLIRSKMVKENNIRFDECLASNDVMFSTRIGYYAKSIFVDPSLCYFVTERRGSLTKVRSKENAFSRYCVWLSYNEFVKKANAKECREMVLSWVLKSLVYFGPGEFIRYLKTAWKMRANIFVKSYEIVISLYHHIKSLIFKDKYIVRS